MLALKKNDSTDCASAVRRIGERRRATSEVCDATAGERRRQTAARSGSQAGDPVRGAQAIIDAALSDAPPLRLLLGRMALDIARRKLESLRGDFDAWEATTVGADFPDASR